MCGIVGVIAPRTDDRDAGVARACEALGHRGPDGSNAFSTDGLALGHTRLSIIDPTARSDQPMTDRETGAVVVFNGEIYNFRELRAELRHEFRFESAGDTETILAAYRRWGAQCVDHLNGMFAFAIWDPARNAVFVARDRLGEKPFLLCRRNGATWFASEAKALFAAGVLEPRTDPRQLFRFLTIADVGHPTQTSFLGIDQLPAAHAGYLDLSGEVRTRRYWVPPRPVRGDPVPVGEISALWEDSVRLRLRSDVPLGTSLSGGVDSSTVLATVRRLRPEGDLHAFTASFPGSDADELPEAEAAAIRIGAVLHPVPLVAQDLTADIDSTIRATESPVEAPSVIAQLRVMQSAADHGIRVLLDGQGGDEVFAGYDKYVGAHLLDLLSAGQLAAARQTRDAWGAAHRRPMHLPYARVVALATGARLRRSVHRAALGRTQAWLAKDYRRSQPTLDPLEGDLSERARPGQWSSAMRSQDLVRVTLPRLLHYGDRVSMTCSREVRLPYLDHRLIDLAARIPLEQSFEEGWSKAPLRKLLDSYGLPQVAWRRDKKNFMPPLSGWLDHPANAQLMRESWSSAHRAGVVAAPTPVDAALPRWRVLAAWRWTELFGVSW